MLEFLFLLRYLYIHHPNRAETNIYQYPIDKYVDKLIVITWKILCFLKEMFNACNRTIFLKFWIFFKLLVKDTINISCAQITPSHKCDKNQLCNTVTNTVKHTISIIISFFIIFTKPNTRTITIAKIWKEIFLVNMFLLSHYRALKTTNKPCK